MANGTRDHNAEARERTAARRAAIREKREAGMSVRRIAGELGISRYHVARLVEDKDCKVGGCDQPWFGRGYCNRHYYRWKRYGDPCYESGYVPRRARPTCALAGCGEPHKSKGYCSSHYHRWRHHGDPLGGTHRRQPGQPGALALRAGIHRAAVP